MRRLYHLAKKMLKLSWWISIFYNNWINIPLTIFFNFYSLPFKHAIKLPIWLYGRPKLLEISGNIKIKTQDIRPGMIKINLSSETPAHSGGNTEFVNKSLIIFKGNAIIGNGCRILVFSGVLEIGNNFRMANRNYIACSKHIEFGEHTILSHEIQVSDTNFHFLCNTNTLSLSNISTPIKIGAYNWIGNRTSIMKGTLTPKHTTVASNSLLNKKYDIPEASIIAGSPAKIVKTGYKRIRDKREELSLITYFANNPNIDAFTYKESTFTESFFEP